MSPGRAPSPRLRSERRAGGGGGDRGTLARRQPRLETERERERERERNEEKKRQRRARTRRRSVELRGKIFSLDYAALQSARL